MARGEPSVCWKVRPLVDVDPLSAGYSALACRRRVLAHEHPSGALENKVLLRTFARLGYEVDQLHLEGVIEPAIRIVDVYRGLERNPAAVDRAMQHVRAPAPSLTGDDASYLAHLSAIAKGDANWCAYIPADLEVNQEQAPFRDWCYYTLAANARDVRICERMRPAAADPKVINAKAHGVRPEIAEQLSLSSQCGVLARGTVPGSPLRYGAELPADPKQMLRLIAEVGVSIPSARDWPEQEIAAYYRRFLFELRPQNRDAVHDAARARLLRGLLSLPEEG
jgi:hypothetical protein